MNKLRRLFGDVSMTWPRVLLLAVGSAVLTALVCILPALAQTSLHDLAVYLDAWFLFALFIILNCKTWQEAAIKCFVFFLVSQPLIYLLQVPFSALGWQIFGYYPRWFILTLLTLPGAAIAFLVKKQNWLSAVVLCVPAVWLAFRCVDAFRAMLRHPPFGLLSSLFCLALAMFFALVLLKKRPHRSLVLGVFAAALVASLFLTRPRSATGGLLLPEGSWRCTVSDETVLDVEVEGSRVTIRSKQNGWAILDFENEAGEIVSYNVVADGDHLQISPID